MSHESAMVKLAEVIVGVGGQASIAFSNIDQKYRSLEVVLTARSDAAGLHGQVGIQFNGDTGSNYDWMGADGNSAADTKIRVNSFPNAGANSNYPGVTRLWVPLYASTSFYKHVSSVWSYVSTPVTDGGSGVDGGAWRSTAAITSILVFPTSGNFVQNTVCSLYGLS